MSKNKISNTVKNTAKFAKNTATTAINTADSVFDDTIDTVSDVVKNPTAHLKRKYFPNWAVYLVCFLGLSSIVTNISQCYLNTVNKIEATTGIDVTPDVLDETIKDFSEAVDSVQTAKDSIRDAKNSISEPAKNSFYKESMEDVENVENIEVGGFNKEQ